MWSVVVKVVHRSLCLLVLSGLLVAPAALAAPPVPTEHAAALSAAVRPFEGTLDATFVPGQGAGVSSDHVYAIAIQPSDGRILIGGSFSWYHDPATVRYKIARVMPGGAVDTSFNSPAWLDTHTVYAIAVQGEKLLIGGFFPTPGPNVRNGIARLNSDGSLDTTFDPSGAGTTDGGVYAIAIQPDGKILIGGSFSVYSGHTRNNVARLNTDGTLDTTFDPGAGPDNRVESIAFQSDPNAPDAYKVIVGGYFEQVSNLPRKHIARLTNTGGVDPNFNQNLDTQINWGVTGSVMALAIQTDNKILMGGGFGAIDGLAASHFLRLTADGAIDPGFDHGGTADSGEVHAIVLQSNGKILVAGQFSQFAGTDRARLARVNMDGSLDTSFDPGLGTDNSVDSMARDDQGRILIGGDFGTYDGVARNHVARVNALGRFTWLPYSKK